MKTKILPQVPQRHPKISIICVPPHRIQPLPLGSTSLPKTHLFVCTVPWSPT